MFAPELIEKIEMINTLIPNENLMVGGQPTINDFHLMKSLGITQVVNLRPNSETIDFDQVALLQQLEMTYTVIPVTEIETFTPEKAEQLKKILTLNQPTLVHCASGNRVGALIALQAFWLEEASAQDSLDKGLQAGLTKLQPDIEKVLGLNN